VGIFSKFAKAYRVYDSNAYREAVSSVEKVASASLSSLFTKSEEEKAEILERVTKLGEKLNDAVSPETPLVRPDSLNSNSRALSRPPRTS
jgi:hypothetical protein